MSQNFTPPLTENQPPTQEGPAWQDIRGRWQPLHGSFARQGLSVEWHEFHLDRELDWSRSFHPGSLEICLNFSGAARFQDRTAVRPLGANELALYTAARAFRHAGSLHRFLTVELAPTFFRTHFSTMLDRLKPPVRAFLENEKAAPAFLEILALPAALLGARMQFLEPPVPEPARETWYLGRVLEILAQTIFAPPSATEFFCQKHHRTNRQRIERVRYLIERDLENPASLEMLAQEVGCSPFYLSRMFRQETGVSIPKFLRMKRIEKAAQCLREGRLNVTEAAMAVGYSSLSAFNTAFVEQIGCCPGLYPLLKSPLPRRTAAIAARAKAI